jgi:predicted esterase
VIERTIATGTHGRYLLEPATAPDAPLLVGFHGYGEGAETQMARLRAIPSAARWSIASIQGLHRFYQRRANEVVASWMTRQDRELAIADNLAYVAAVVEEIARERPFARLVFAGFSQGVAMAFRAAAACSRPVAGAIAAGGDIPPEIASPALARLRTVLLCRGLQDNWYTAEKFADDLARLRAAGVDVQPLEFDTGHEWADDVVRAASTFLDERAR